MTRFALIISLLGHALLIGMFVLATHRTVRHTNRVSFINAHIEVNSGILAKIKNQSGKKNHHLLSSRMKISKISEQGIAKSQITKHRYHKQANSVSPGQQKVISRSLQKKKIDALLVKIHNLIYAKQHYPQTAWMMGVEGASRVGFILYPDGHLTHIVLLQSSGNASLDRAAILSVKAINPILQVQKYINQKTPLSTWIRFQIK